MKFKVRGPDERYHVFRQVDGGGWQHFSRMPGDSFSVLEDSGRIFNLQEVRDYVDFLSGFGPITKGEVEWIRMRARTGDLHDGVDWGKEAVEPEADPDRVKPTPMFQCVECSLWWEETEKRRFTWDTFPADKGYCIRCHTKRIRDMGFRGG